MSVKTIAVVLFDSTEAPEVIEGATSLAAKLDAHLIAMHPFRQVVFTDGMGFPPMLFATYQEWQNEESDKICDLFEDRARKEGLQYEFRRQPALYGSEQFLLSAARGTDLVIMGGNGCDTRSPDDQSLAERLIRNLGRPVLVLPPNAHLSGPAERITIGWSETRETTRAAHDALDLAAPGASIDLVALLARASDDIPGIDTREDFAAALDRRGFKATVSDRLSAVESRGEELLRAAKEKNADLVVAGAFGHSQFYDFVIGAVTSYLLKSHRLPILLSR